MQCLIDFNLLFKFFPYFPLSLLLTFKLFEPLLKRKLRTTLDSFEKLDENCKTLTKEYIKSDINLQNSVGKQKKNIKK